MPRTEYFLLCDSGECAPKEKGSFPARKAAIRAADLASMRQPQLDWWVESRTRIWGHEREPVPDDDMSEDDEIQMLMDRDMGASG